MPDTAALLDKLFTSLDKHDDRAMASCYHDSAHFRDIAFDLDGRKQIHSMWAMICDGDIRVQFEILEANDRFGRVKLVDTYTFGTSKDSLRPGRPIRNSIESSFIFKDGLILRHDDDCDPKAWAKSALANGFIGFFAGRIRLLRSHKARSLLAAFVAKHPEYRSR
jgi:hypothetical protein